MAALKLQRAVGHRSPSKRAADTKQILSRVEPAIRRMLVCISASTALHALTLAADRVEIASTQYTLVSVPVLRAALTPLKLASTAAYSANNERHDVERPHSPTPSMAEPTESSKPRQDVAKAYLGDDELEDMGGTTDKWYTAEELDARAEPLTALKLAYPEQLAGRRMRGRVRIVLFIDEQGSVRDAQVIASQPKLVFDDAALQAWRNVRFSPALKGSQAVKSTKLLEVDFGPD